MKAKNILSVAACLSLFATANAQQWSGNNNLTDPIQRAGNVTVWDGVSGTNYGRLTKDGIRFAAYATMYEGQYVSLTKTGLSLGYSVPASTPGASVTHGKISVWGAAPAGTTVIQPQKITIPGGSDYTSGQLVINGFTLTGSSVPVQNGANFGISYGTSTLFNINPGTKLMYFDGKFEAEEIEVKNVGADFVFADSYKLRSLSEVEQFIKANKHLPDVAPANVTEKGIKVGEFSETLLQKVEELTLYIIEQQKQIDQMKVELSKK